MVQDDSMATRRQACPESKPQACEVNPSPVVSFVAKERSIERTVSDPAVR